MPLFSTVETNVKVLTQRDIYLTQSPASDQQILFHQNSFPVFLGRKENFLPAVALRCDLLFQMVENPVKARLHGLDSAAMTSNMRSRSRVKWFSISIIALQPTEEDATHLLVTLH